MKMLRIKLAPSKAPNEGIFVSPLNCSGNIFLCWNALRDMWALPERATEVTLCVSDRYVRGSSVYKARINTWGDHGVTINRQSPYMVEGMRKYFRRRIGIDTKRVWVWLEY